VNKIICITGAGSGFGEACAFLFSANNYNLIITGRRAERLYALKKTLEEKFNNKVLVLPLDVSDRTAVDKAFKIWIRHGRKLTCC
jgi:NADP-dependent 3-hydroxy acid dehydrogenase YdfG